MKKVLFTFYVDNMVDLITNSSSELFVFSGNSKEELQHAISSEVPDYLSEYEELTHSSEMSNYQLDYFLGYHLHSWDERRRKVLPGFEYDEMYEEVQLTKYSYTKLKPVTDENRQKYIDAIDPNGKMYFMFSLDENPNWDNQERLMRLGERYHLG